MIRTFNCVDSVADFPNRFLPSHERLETWSRPYFSVVPLRERISSNQLRMTFS